MTIRTPLINKRAVPWPVNQAHWSLSGTLAFAQRAGIHGRIEALASRVYSHSNGTTVASSDGRDLTLYPAGDIATLLERVE